MEKVTIKNSTQRLKHDLFVHFDNVLVMRRKFEKNEKERGRMRERRERERKDEVQF